MVLFSESTWLIKNLFTSWKSTADIKILIETCRNNIQVHFEKSSTWSFNVWQRELENQCRPFPKIHLLSELYIPGVKQIYSGISKNVLHWASIIASIHWRSKYNFFENSPGYWFWTWSIDFILKLFVSVIDMMMWSRRSRCESLQTLHNYTLFKKAFFEGVCHIICNVSNLCVHQPILSFHSHFSFLCFYFHVFLECMSSSASTSRVGRTSDLSENICFLLLEVLSSDEFLIYRV